MPEKSHPQTDEWRRLATEHQGKSGPVGMLALSTVHACNLIDRQALKIKAIQAANQMFVEYEKRVEEQLRHKDEQIAYKDEIIKSLKAKKKQQTHELTRLAELRQKHERKYATIKGQLKEQAEELHYKIEEIAGLLQTIKSLDQAKKGEGPYLNEVSKGSEQ